MIANAQSDTIFRVTETRDWSRLDTLFGSTLRDERLVAIALCSPDGELLHFAGSYPVWLGCAGARELAAKNPPELRQQGEVTQISLHAVSYHERKIGDLVLLQDMALIQQRRSSYQHFQLSFMLTLGLTTLVLTLLFARFSRRSWARSVGQMLRDGAPQDLEAAPELGVLAEDMRTRLRDLEDEYRRMRGLQTEWTPQRLRTLLNSQLTGDEVIVVSNREPYSHERIDGEIVVHQPASGLITALEPIVRACGGTWIAHGSGSADREAVDAHDRVPAPPAAPEFTLRRIWLSEEEERGYYHGMANQGIWPMCHMAHVRPVFRESDWAMYQAVNQRFADAVAAEARSRNPIVLLQDYQLALAPAMIRRHLPEATILSFWHIPWPNAEMFATCPWRFELLEGLLGSTIMGFQTRHDSQNFLATVDRCLEARIEHEHGCVFHQDHETRVVANPISIDWPATPTALRPAQETLRESLDLPASRRLILGVDRFDYIKGIEERLTAFEQLLETHPEWVGEVSLLQLASPTRDTLREYSTFQARVRQQVAALNQRFGTPAYQPVIFLEEYRNHEGVEALYRGADVCIVSSLHDGMNLVSKEFVAARDDGLGVLILSSFAGASKELTEALIINPYHTEEMTEAMHQALSMHPEEQKERMSSLRMQVRDANVYRWAGSMLTDAARWRLRERFHKRIIRYQER